MYEGQNIEANSNTKIMINYWKKKNKEKNYKLDEKFDILPKFIINKIFTMTKTVGYWPEDIFFIITKQNYSLNKWHRFLHRNLYTNQWFGRCLVLYREAIYILSKKIISFFSFFLL